MIIDIACEDGTTQIARIVHEYPDAYEVQFLERNAFKWFDFTPELLKIEKESVSGFYDVHTLEETLLFVKVPQGYELIDDSEDEDYSCSESDESDDDVSLVDENEA
jgi:hypothetical protein